MRAKKQRERGYTREYYHRNRAYFIEYQKERKQHKYHNITESEWSNCKKYFNNSCAYCETPLESHFKKYRGTLKHTDLHKEHVDHEGANDLSNCVPACQLCNSKKWAFALEEWYNSENEIYSEKRLEKINKWVKSDFKNFIENKLM